MYLCDGLQDTDIRVHDCVILQWGNREYTLGGIDSIDLLIAKYQCR